MFLQPPLCIPKYFNHIILNYQRQYYKVATHNFTIYHILSARELLSFSSNISSGIHMISIACTIPCYSHALFFQMPCFPFVMILFTI